MIQPRFYTHEPEGAYFAQCIEVDVLSAAECGGSPVPTTQAPITTTESTTQAPQPQPTTPAPQPEPTTDAPQPEPTTAQPEPTTAQPEPTTVAPQPEPTTQAPTTTESAGSIELWGKCGGKGYTGSTSCVPNASCEVVNVWYSQCKPKPVEE